ncbi:DUF4344 domain-containing metallopeptidase [Nonomuraea typhae]|uniref:DUF4344 domain-containing metallopeptidase n=1 Tax=Nonomuraea typhae TaxID=2603600 RepID=UPI0012F8BCF2|nr:DUF4344 domain-containing metallopeptidase [Nonomuraea typhae]
MKRALLVSGVLAVALSGCGITPLPGVVAVKASPASPGPSAAAFVPVYETPENKDLTAAEKLLRDNRLVQRWAEAANQGFVPPRNVSVTARQCDEINAFYNSEDPSITMCYEMVDYLRKLFATPEKGAPRPDVKEVDESALGAMSGIYFHELGHALIDLYDLPATGREEDAVDQLSALVLITTAEKQKDYSQIISTIETWGRISQEEAKLPLDQRDFADDHSLSRQRYYNMMCYLYGSNHNAFLPLVSEGELPVARAARCEEEYAKMSRAWTRLLEPHLRTDLPSPSPGTARPS